jgi:hypothetical protein
MRTHQLEADKGRHLIDLAQYHASFLTISIVNGLLLSLVRSIIGKIP